MMASISNIPRYLADEPTPMTNPSNPDHLCTSDLLGEARRQRQAPPSYWRFPSPCRTGDRRSQASDAAKSDKAALSGPAGPCWDANAYEY